MVDKKAIKKEFAELQSIIGRLKQAETALNNLRPPEGVFDSQIASIRSKLKDPARVDEVEQELSNLLRQVGEHKPEGDTGDFTGIGFPRELEPLYYDVVFIGGGGFAKVFRAKRQSDGIEVAVKVPEKLDARTGEIFLSEISAWRRLSHRNSHRNIVELYDCNILPIPYLEMEYCTGNLDTLPRPMDIGQAAGILFHIAEGVDYAHSKGIVHRDLKPQNILLQGEVPKIADWGLSKVISESKYAERHAFSLPWAAPEQVSPEKFGKPDERTDVYQLGFIFYELATGEFPFKGANPAEIMGQIIEREPEAPSLRHSAASAVEPIIMKCLKKQMDDRYESIGELQKELAEYLQIEYEESLTKSQGDITRSRYYCTELCLVHLKLGDIGEALKCALDLRHNASGAAKSGLDSLISDLEFRLKQGMEVGEELLASAGIVLHQVRLGR